MLKSSGNVSFGVSPRENVPTSPPTASALDVFRISQGSSCSSSDGAVVMVKLTDEMFAALEQCQRSGKKIRIRVDDQGGVIELGDGSASSASTNGTFRFQKQSLPDATDTLVQQPGGVVKNVGTYRTKYQIQATDKSFEETRKRAEKRAEEEKKRGTKHVKERKDVSRHGGLLTSSSAPRNLGSSVAPLSSASSRVSPPLKGPAASTSVGQKNGAVPNSANKTDLLKGELMRKGLRKRIIHLVVTQRYKNWEDVHKKLRADGMSEDQDVPQRIEDCVRDVAEMSSSCAYLSLRQSLVTEVDPRWPFFNQDEKAAVRKLLTASSGMRTLTTDSSASFAPTRKKGMERMTAGTRSTNVDKQNSGTIVASEAKPVSPEVIPTPPMSRPSSGGSNSVTKAELTPVSEDDYMVASQGVKRKAHSSATTAAAVSNMSQPAKQDNSPPAVLTSSFSSMEKRPRRFDSSSPPEDPMTNNESVAMKMNSVRAPVLTTIRQNMTSNQGEGSTASSRISSPASSLSSPSQPSCDWEKQFGEIKTVSEAERYFSMFHNEYPAYMNCYRVLIEVSKEFRSLEHKLKSAMSRKGSSSSSNSKEVSNVEREIQNRFSHYEKDPEFLRARQRHTDLRSKLAVLKSRITSWETVQQRSIGTS